MIRVALVSASIQLVGGCFGLGQPGPIDGIPPPGQNGDPGNGGSELAVTLRVSNPTPQPNEQVVLTCTLVDGGGSANVTFDFQPTFGRLVVNSNAGTASFIVDQTDVGVALTFTCTASNDEETSLPSNSQTVVASP